MGKKIDLTGIKDKDLEMTSSFSDLVSRKEKKRIERELQENIDIEEMILEKKRSTADLTKELNKKENTEKKEIDLNNIKEKDLDESSYFSNLLTKKERKKKEEEEKLQKEFEKVKKEYQKSIDDNIEKTQILELTRQMKYNFEENKKENIQKKKKGISPLNIIGEINLLCIGYYIYLLVFTNYQDNEINYMINGGIIVLLVILFGLSVVTGKKLSKFFNILNILTIFGFIIFNIYTLLN